MTTKRRSEAAARNVSPRTLALFMAYLHWYMPRHFHALRIAYAERFPAGATPLIVCINHASWWDPLTILVLSRFLAPARHAYAPMEAEALAHYGFFRRLGAFPVDNSSSHAALQFLRQAKAIVTRPRAVLWMTPEGRFTDARTSSVVWRPGTAALTRHLEKCTVIPIAIEYIFWDERLPEILCAVGEPLCFTSADTSSTQDRNTVLQAAMSKLQVDLAARACKRDAALFTAVFAGDTGINAGYDLWQRLKARMRGRPYVAGHGMIAPK